MEQLGTFSAPRLCLFRENQDSKLLTLDAYYRFWPSLEVLKKPGIADYSVYWPRYALPGVVCVCVEHVFGDALDTLMAFV